VFWKHLKKVYNEGVPPLQCHRGCAHCCHTGVSCTQMEWDGILKNAEENNIDLDAVLERSQRTIKKVDEVLKANKNLEQVDWHRLVTNQPCPFLSKEGACEVYEDRPLDCRMVVAFRGVCESKNLEHAQRGVVLEEAVGATRHDPKNQTQKVSRYPTHQTSTTLADSLERKKQKVKKLVSRLQNPLNPPCQGET
jgi:Fe-S-cluster containining protein